MRSQLSVQTRLFVAKRCACQFSYSAINAIDLISLKSPDGMRDFYPGELAQRSWMHGIWKNASRKFGFEQIDTPLVEYLDMYDRNTCEEVLKETEHYQWNMDIWGVAGVEAEAELLSAAITALRDSGLSNSDVVFKISSVKIVNSLFQSVGVATEHCPTAAVLLSRWLQEKSSVSDSELAAAGITSAQLDSVASELNVKDIDYFAAKLGRDSEGVADVLRLQQLLRLYGLQDWAVFDASVVRGLAYYTGIVFEAFDRQGALRAVCGGGRYDHMLLPMFVVHGEYPTAAAGFAVNDRALEALLRTKGLLPPIAVVSSSAQVTVCALGEVAQSAAYSVARSLRASNVSADMLLGDSAPGALGEEDVVRRAQAQATQQVLVVSTGSNGKTKLRRMDRGSDGEYTVEAYGEADKVLKAIAEQP